MAIPKMDIQNKHLFPPGKPNYTHKSDERVVTSIDVKPTNTASLPEVLLISMEQVLEIGVPVQVQFEITPVAAIAWTENDPSFPGSTGFYAYHCSVKSVKSRIKPGTKEFIGKEELNLEHVINGTEESEEAKQRAKKRMQKANEKSEANRFTGLEI